MHLPDPRPNQTPEDLRFHAGNIDLLGFTVVSEVFGEGELATARDLLDQAYASYDPDVDSLSRVPGYHFSANLVNKGPFFEALFLREPVYGLVRSRLGEDCILSSLNSLEPLQGQGDQALHRDGGYPRSHRVMSMNSWWVVDDMGRDNGATRIVPGSHRNEDTPSDMAPRAIHVEIPAGSAVVTNARIVHGASANHSGERRRVMHVYFVRRGEPQQTEQRAHLSQEVQSRLSPAARRVLALDPA